MERDREMEYRDCGVCPHCGGNDGYLNVGRTHWFVCHTHKTRWWIGCNMVTTWKQETEDDWKKNAEILAGYTMVEPKIAGRRPPRRLAAGGMARYA